MNLLIKSATIIDPKGPYHQKQQDILIRDGKINRIADSIQSDVEETFSAPNLHLSKGWIDMQANFQDPGLEHKEDLESGIQAAASGGFTSVCLTALTEPVRDSKSQVEYVVNKGKNSLVNLLPYGTISNKGEGKELAELYDMKQAGALAFFDGKKPLKNVNLLHRALLYTQAFEGLVINFPFQADLAENAVMNESETSTELGLKGIPEVCEELMINRDLYLLEYTKGKLHLATVTSKKGVELIKAAQKNGLTVSCDVSAAHLLIDDSALKNFDSRLKTLPPFRTKSTIKALIKGIKEGTIKAISSDHWPQDIESKKKEFDHAAFGLINLQTAFSVARTATKEKIELDTLVSCFTTGPAEILGLNLPKIEEGEVANFSLFDPEGEFIFTKEMVVSKSKNSPFFGMKLRGKVYGIVNESKYLLKQ